MDVAAVESILSLFDEIEARVLIENASVRRGVPMLDAEMDALLAVTRMELDLADNRDLDWYTFTRSLNYLDWLRREAKAEFETIRQARRPPMWRDLSDDELEHRLLLRGVTPPAASYAVDHRDDEGVVEVIDRWLD